MGIHPGHTFRRCLPLIGQGQFTGSVLLGGGFQLQFQTLRELPLALPVSEGWSVTGGHRGFAGRGTVFTK